MNAIPFGRAVHKPASPSPDESRLDGSLDNAWLVLEAANDLRDCATVEICRRVIDASLNGRPAAPSDLHVLQNYFS
jgi:hypothetical protein